MRFLNRSLLLAALAALVMPTFASADVVNFDIGADNLYTGLAGAPDAEGTGALWNGIGTGALTPPPGGYVDSGGNTVPVTLNIDGGGVFFNNTSDQELLADPNVNGSTIENLLGDYTGVRAGNNSNDLRTSTINGLIAGNTYDLYLYGQGDNFTDTNNNGGQNAGFRILGGTDVRHTSHDGVNGGDGLLEEDVEYVVFRGVEAVGGVEGTATGSITFEHFNPGTGLHGTDPAFADSSTGSFDEDGNNSRFHALNGFQIVGDFTAIPEPSSLALLLFGATALAGRRRRS